VPEAEALLRLDGVSVAYHVRYGWRAHRVLAVNDVSLTIRRGEAVGLVGESGSGKSTLGRAAMGLVQTSAGNVIFDGVLLSRASSRQWRALRRRMQIVFQDPQSSLDPRRRVGDQIADGPVIHGLMPRDGRREGIAAALARVHLDPASADRYPHEFSGGQRQRIGIARALATGPDFVVADEPVSALDVSVQAQIIDLMIELKSTLHLALLFISHDLSVVRHLCDRIAVMYLGRIVERGLARSVLTEPAHPYTQALLAATPSLAGSSRGEILLEGEPPSPLAPPSGCVFRTRCRFAQARCAVGVPPFVDIAAGHQAACIRVGEADGPAPWTAAKVAV
jgi:oligopeptide/dipeptide ABC transporter ATP-binding protein